MRIITNKIKMNTKDENRYFYNTSFPLACFLFSKNMQMSQPRDVGGGKKEFVWIKTPILEELVRTYKFEQKDAKELLISVRVYEQARRELLDILNN